MKIFVINCGSSSLKYQLFNVDTEELMAKGLVERIGMDGSVLKHQPNGKDKVVIEQDIPDHKVAVQLVINALVDKSHGVISDISEISAVGHRILHGGSKYSSSILVTDEVIEDLKELIPLGPLHMPGNITGITACKILMPNVPNVAVFDTAFHQTMPEDAYMYAIPYELYEKHAIRRYGFHGTSHRYVSKRAAEMLNKPLEDLKLITCHIGNGSSFAAVKNGKSIDTSMGFTPLEGLVMGTRSGDIDPAVVQYLVSNAGMTVDEVNDILNKKSGFLGLSGISSDSRDIEDAALDGNKRAIMTLKVFYHRAKKYIGAYAAIMGGVDAIVFTAGIGENSHMAREHICEGLDFLGIKIDKEKNMTRGKEVDISAKDSKVKILIIPTNEELMIARDTMEIVQSTNTAAL